MAGRRAVTPPSVPPDDNGEVLGQYLASLEGLLVGSTRDRARALDEIRGGLEDATADYTSRALPAPAAAQAAVDDLGPPSAVARAFAGELATRLARRILWALLLTGPLVGIWWFLLFAPVPWSPHPGMLLAAIPVLPLIAAAVGIALVAIATTGSLIRWLPETAPKRALLAATVVAVACMLGDLAMLSVLGFRSASGEAGLLPIALVITAITASSLRLVCAAWCVRACRRARSALHR